MIADWNALSKASQLHLAGEAHLQASVSIARQAEELAQEFEAGVIADRGGAKALRLMSAALRSLLSESKAPVGSA